MINLSKAKELLEKFTDTVSTMHYTGCMIEEELVTLGQVEALLADFIQYEIEKLEQNVSRANPES